MIKNNESKPAQQPSAQVPEEWINCKDRKPGYPITVLGAYESDDEGIPCLDVGEVCLFPDGKWYGIGIFYKGKKDPEFAPEICVKKVHFWKPLPQPPKLDGTEDVTTPSIVEKNRSRLDTANDYEKLKQLFTEFGIEFEEQKGSSGTDIMCFEGEEKIKGWSCFYTKFVFDKDGKFIEMGCWE